MGKAKRKKKGSRDREYQFAVRLVREGRHEEAVRTYARLKEELTPGTLRTRVVSDLAVLAAVRGELEAARAGFAEALALDPACEAARRNLELLEADIAAAQARPVIMPQVDAPPEPPAVEGRVAILSFLFNWPSTGGGIVHTVELAQFLEEAGCEVRHFYVRYRPWQIGVVEKVLPYPCEGLEFDEATWNVPEIQQRVREAVTAFAPDHVIITDSWNMKPLLAEAVAEFPYILRLQALECLCPLNNVRLLPEPGGRFRQCPLHQLASPDECTRCVQERGHLSGSLHQAERALAGVGTPEYAERLRRVVKEAEAVLVVNPLAEAMVSPYAQCVRVVTAGMDPVRFPWPWPEEGAGRAPGQPVRFFFAGLVQEFMKGFHVLHEACALLWQRRRDFELVGTGEPVGQQDEFTRFVGWLSQEDLPRHLRAADVLVMPTIAQEALGRTAVEAMAVGRPVVASRIGGLPFTVAEGATGLLCEPGDAHDLAAKLEHLLDDPGLRERLGQAGRKRFEEHYAWDVIVEKHYRPLLRRQGDASQTRRQGDKETRRQGELEGRNGYRPFIPDAVDEGKLVEDVSRFFGLERCDVEGKLETYRAFHKANGYAQTLGELKTLCFEEAFILGVLLGAWRPRTLVEIGTQHGCSTRRLLDLLGLLGLKSRMVCFDVADEVRHFRREEAELVLCDVTGRFEEQVLQAYAPDFLFLDVHTYALLKEAVTVTLNRAPQCVLALHDCGRGLCNPHMAISRDDPIVTSFTGVWERHVLAEVFGIADPLGDRLDEAETATHRLRIFDTPHGLGILEPRGTP